MKLSLSIVCFSVFSLFGYAQVTTCKCSDEIHGQFDFWLGSWNVTNPDGSVAGTNIVEKDQDNCILRENWTSAKGNFTGTSINFYNSKTKEWEQVWVDNQGGNLHLKGMKIGNQMILRSEESKNKKGQLFFNRITWTLNEEDGSVRQLWEIITNKKEVSIAFDGLYKKTE